EVRCAQLLVGVQHIVHLLAIKLLESRTLELASPSSAFALAFLERKGAVFVLNGNAYDLFLIDFENRKITPTLDIPIVQEARVAIDDVYAFGTVDARHLPATAALTCP